ncbi:MAG: ferritin-like domain-containing protein [Ferruginibacter sp.]|nr:ferritin-like domain-containing protein [Cytophagales bacterium]
MKLETLRNLYISQLQDIYSTEKQIEASLPKLARAASNPKLKAGFDKHLAETKNQAKRLEQIFRSLGISSGNDTSPPMIGLAAEGQEVIRSSGDDHVQDAALIAAAQKIEHYEIASYGTLLAYAKLLGDVDSAKLLKASLEEEKATDKRLTILAEGLVNRQAVRASGYGGGGFGEEDGGLSFLGILLGAAAGVAAGMLLAPTTGEDARKKLLEGALALWDQYGGKAGELADVARTTFQKVAGQPQEVNDGGQ